MRAPGGGNPVALKNLGAFLNKEEGSLRALYSVLEMVATRGAARSR